MSPYIYRRSFGRADERSTSAWFIVWDMQVKVIGLKRGVMCFIPIMRCRGR